ncbi:hypothetical protein [Mycolicibacterium sediminis]|uniref:Lipoprotein n=1 Tax=Mycolicibacterium sediminis TaxID=1286180 RepID=A0A7I7QPJ9_9MYCO|nr:hypothetical protein [Mycolicibacterium sediminis]BBY27990.1 hypothetical protein MSEDJ_20860 [Mycolicibacterium sediminis]
MSVMRCTKARFMAVVGSAVMLLGPIPLLAGCTDGGGDAPSFTTTQSSLDDSTPTSDRHPEPSGRPDGDDSEIGTGSN